MWTGSCQLTVETKSYFYFPRGRNGEHGIVPFSRKSFFNLGYCLRRSRLSGFFNDRVLIDQRFSMSRSFTVVKSLYVFMFVADPKTVRCRTCNLEAFFFSEFAAARFSMGLRKKALPSQPKTPTKQTRLFFSTSVRYCY